MILETVVNYSFRIINLLVLIGLGIYLFKKYFLVSLEDAMADQETFQSGLQQQEGALENRLDEIEVEKNMLEAQCTTLKNKVDRWRNRFDEVMQERKEEKLLLQKKIATMRNTQEINFTQAKLLKKTVPTALANARVYFITTYSQEKKGSDYLRTLIDSLRKTSLHG